MNNDDYLEIPGFLRRDHQQASTKPLFIPLKTRYYEAFINGSKTEELRRYGPRWNEKNCAVGRDVVLSKGYGKQHRIAAKVWKFKQQHGSLFGSTYKAEILNVFGTLDIQIACISITLSEIGAKDND